MEIPEQQHDLEAVRTMLGGITKAIWWPQGDLRGLTLRPIAGMVLVA